jgi:hypothetical protein
MTATSLGVLTSPSNRAASFTVGWTASVRPIRWRSPERCNIAGVWIAPPHTMTSRKLMVTGRSPSIVDVSSARSAVAPCITIWSRR